MIGLQRADCSLADAFHRIKSGVAKDVELMNARQQRYAFKFTDNGSDFVVSVLLPHIHAFVTFRLKRMHIEFVDRGGSLTTATVALNDDGDCLVKVNGRTREFWQFRKDALEPLFFGLED